MVKVALDAMGGDNAPLEIVRGAVKAVKENPDVEIVLCGVPEAIEKALKEVSYTGDRITVYPASEVIDCNEAPVMAIRKKKDSSIVKGIGLVKSGECDGFISAGSTGAVLAGGQLLVGRIKGVERPPLAPLVPTDKGVSLIVDCGANVDARPSWLLQFAKIGSIYMENALGIKNPTVAIVNIGLEEEKGNDLVKEAYPLLKNCPDINFIGSIEAREIPHGGADVVVCDAFVGNVILKLYEGVGSTLINMIKSAIKSNLRSMIGGVLVKPSIKKVMKLVDATEYGGAPLLGLKGLVVKVHGNCTEKEISNAIKQCITFKNQDISGKIASRIVTNDEGV